MDIKSDVLDFIRNEVLEDPLLELNESDKLLSQGILDSLGLMRTVRFLEKKYKFTIPFEDINLDNFDCINSINEYVYKVNN
ncbi:phosphopantetheine-binding protein [Winogradskyella sp.]|uniref:phosphopantetheine-binding protein n=1 Tax=Winogradskyella sp. TaxID=1883156 RepID=UPI003BA91D2D